MLKAEAEEKAKAKAKAENPNPPKSLTKKRNPHNLILPSSPPESTATKSSPALGAVSFFKPSYCPITDTPPDAPLEISLISKLLCCIHTGIKHHHGEKIGLINEGNENFTIIFGARHFVLSRDKKLGAGNFGNVYQYIINEKGTESAISIAAKFYREDSDDADPYETEIEKHQRACTDGNPFIVQLRGNIKLPAEREGVLLLDLYPISLAEAATDEQKKIILGDMNHWLRIKAIVEDIANGLFHLYKRSLLHLDLKLDNVLLTKEGRAALGDFGCSQTFEKTKDSSRIVGTFRTHSPESISNINKSACDDDKQKEPQPNISNIWKITDGWALGLIIKELLELPLPTPPLNSSASEIDRHANYIDWAENYKTSYCTYIARESRTLCNSDPDYLLLNALANCLLAPLENRPNISEIINKDGVIDTEKDWIARAKEISELYNRSSALQASSLTM